MVKDDDVGVEFKTALEFTDALYQPNVTAKMLRALFAHFEKKNQIFIKEGFQWHW